MFMYRLAGTDLHFSSAFQVLQVFLPERHGYKVSFGIAGMAKLLITHFSNLVSLFCFL